MESNATATVNTTRGETGVDHVVVSVVSTETKTIAWHILARADSVATEAALTHVRVLLETLWWQEDAPRVAEIAIVVEADSAPQWRGCVETFARAKGYEVLQTTRERVEDTETKDESVRMVLSPTAIAAYNNTQRSAEEIVFESCLDATYIAMMEHGAIHGNPRLERAFQLTVETHSAPLRPYLRLDQAAQKMWINPNTRHASPSISGLLRPLCRTKSGRKALHQRLEQPELDITVLRKRHDHLNELVTCLNRSDEVGLALTVLFDDAAYAEGTHAWFLGGHQQRGVLPRSSPTLQEVRAFCVWVRRLASKSEALQCSLQAAGARLLNGAYTSRLSSSLSAVTDTFVDQAERQLDSFLTGDHGDANRIDTISTLRRQIKECEQAIEAHHEETATQLLLPPERIKVVYEDDDFTASRSTAPSVVFRVTRQDGHRVFKASADTNAQPEARRMTLVFSRRTTGVWFSTRQLDALAAQRRALHLDITRLEAQLVASLVQQYDLHAREEIHQCVTSIADLDVLSAFAQASIRHNFSRATVKDNERLLEVEGLRWPWGELSDPRGTRASPKRVRLSPRSPDSTQFLRISGDHRTLAMHSALDNDVSILSRLALTILLNQAGCFVPCQKATLPIFDALFVRSGAVDDTLANRSTFLSEMQQMSAILNRATPNSLVLIDELCRGTAPGEGLPLAVAICEHLAEVKVFTCLSTQWTELFDALVGMEHVTVPAHIALAPSSVNDMKRAYRERLRACDTRFIACLNELDFPPELVEDIAQDLAVPRDTN